MDVTLLFYRSSHWELAAKLRLLVLVATPCKSTTVARFLSGPWCGERRDSCLLFCSVFLSQNSLGGGICPIRVAACRSLQGPLMLSPQLFWLRKIKQGRRQEPLLPLQSQSKSSHCGTFMQSCHRGLQLQYDFKSPW